MNEPTLHLHSADLMSKWGFNDGDEPEHLMDHWDDVGLDYSAIDWHGVLRILVRRYLLPALAEHHEIELYDFETIHNPIRASRVDGVEIDHYYDHGNPVLMLESVEVSYEQVMAVVQELAPP